jgi:hypothetical protein
MVAAKIAWMHGTGQMIWIIPRRSPFSPFVPATEASNSDWPAHWQTLCESLLWRSKPTPWRTWRRRLRKVSWLSRLCGRTCEPSRQSDFEAALISSLRATRVSRSPSPASESGRPTLDTFGRILQQSCGQLSLFGASSRTSPDTLALDSPQFTKAYETWVMQLRQDCLQRQSAARPTSGNGCSSWPTASEMDVKNPNPRMLREGRAAYDNLSRATQWPTPDAMVAQDGESPETWLARREKLKQTANNGNGCGTPLAMAMQLLPTPRAEDAESCGGHNSRQVADSLRAAVTWLTPKAPSGGGQAQRTTPGGGLRKLEDQVECGEISGPPAPDSPSMSGKNQESLWGTPRVTTNGGTPCPEHTGKGSRLEDQAATWSTPRVEERSQHNSQDYGQALSRQIRWMTSESQNQSGYQIVKGKRIPRLGTQAKGKLNPDWVEQLMGLPVGWTGFACSATVSFLPKPKERSGNSTKS